MCECCYNGREQCCCCGNAAMVVGITGVFCNCICCGRAPAYCHCCCCCRRRVCGAPPDRVHRWNEAAGRALHEVELTRAALKDIHANVQHLVAVSAKDQGRFQALARLRQVERECAVRMQDLAAALMQQERRAGAEMRGLQDALTPTLVGGCLSCPPSPLAPMPPDLLTPLALDLLTPWPLTPTLPLLAPAPPLHPLLLPSTLLSPIRPPTPLPHGGLDPYPPPLPSCRHPTHPCWLSWWQWINSWRTLDVERRGRRGTKR